MLPALPAWLLWSGCVMGPSVETVVDELRVVVFRPLDPELAPGETTALEGVIADPDGDGYDWIVWTCTALGDGCLEAAAEDTAWTGLTVDAVHEDAPASGIFGSSVTVDPALFALASETPLPLVGAYALVCAEGLCPVIDQALSAPAPGTPEAEALRTALSDPFALLETLPLEGVSLASWRVDVSVRAQEERRTHPVLGDCLFASPATEPRTVPPEGRLEATCAVEGPFDADAALWGYATAGGWEGQALQVAPGTTEADPYIWIAPTEDDAPEALGLWLVLTDGLGGLDWKAVEVEVRTPEPEDASSEER